MKIKYVAWGIIASLVIGISSTYSMEKDNSLTPQTNRKAVQRLRLLSVFLYKNPSFHILFLAKTDTAQFLDMIRFYPQLLEYKIMQQRFMSTSHDHIYDFFTDNDNQITCIQILAKEMTNIAFLKLYTLLPPDVLNESIIKKRLYAIKRSFIKNILLSNIPYLIFNEEDAIYSIDKDELINRLPLEIINGTAYDTEDGFCLDDDSNDFSTESDRGFVESIWYSFHYYLNNLRSKSGDQSIVYPQPAKLITVAPEVVGGAQALGALMATIYYRISHPSAQDIPYFHEMEQPDLHNTVPIDWPHRHVPPVHIPQWLTFQLPDNNSQTYIDRLLNFTQRLNLPGPLSSFVGELSISPGAVFAIARHNITEYQKAYKAILQKIAQASAEDEFINKNEELCKQRTVLIKHIYQLFLQLINAQIRSGRLEPLLHLQQIPLPGTDGIYFEEIQSALNTLYFHSTGEANAQALDQEATKKVIDILIDFLQVVSRDQHTFSNHISSAVESIHDESFNQLLQKQQFQKKEYTPTWGRIFSQWRHGHDQARVHNQCIRQYKHNDQAITFLNLTIKDPLSRDTKLGIWYDVAHYYIEHNKRTMPEVYREFYSDIYDRYAQHVFYPDRSPLVIAIAHKYGNELSLHDLSQIPYLLRQDPEWTNLSIDEQRDIISNATELDAWIKKLAHRYHQKHVIDTTLGLHPSHLFTYELIDAVGEEYTVDTTNIQKRIEDYIQNTSEAVQADFLNRLTTIAPQEGQKIKNLINEKKRQKGKKKKIAQKQQDAQSAKNKPSGDDEDPTDNLVVPATGIAKQRKHSHGQYEDAAYHHKNSRGAKSPAPKDGQTALDKSIDIPGSARRVGLSKGQIVVLDKTTEGSYHGHIRTLDQLRKDGKKGADILKAMRRQGWIGPRGKKIYWPSWAKE